MISSTAVVVLLGWLLIISGVAQGLSLIGARHVPHFWLQLISVILAVLIMPVSIVWGSLYLGFGSPVGVVPYVYFAVSLGYRTVRGSSSRGAARALRGAERELQEGRAVAFTPDGPRGPRRELARQ